jgi:hypothetical protein
VDVVSTGLVDTSSRGLIGVLVNRALELFQELVNVQEIALGPQIWERQRIRVVHGRVRGLSNHCAAVPVIAHAAAALVATATSTKNGKLHALETHQSLANVVVSGRVNGTALGIAEEFVKSIVSGTLTDLVVVVQLLRLVHSVVNGTIRRILRRATVKSGGSTSRVLLAIAAIGTKGAIRILVSTRCSGKRLQVSDNCSTPVRN